MKTGRHNFSMLSPSHITQHHTEMMRLGSQLVWSGLTQHSTFGLSINLKHV